MTESYRLGTSVNPAEMSLRLTYSSGGALYWPSNYRLVNESSGALSTAAPGYAGHLWGQDLLGPAALGGRDRL